MPLLINNSSGLAEDLPQQAADQALAQGTHGIPLMNPNGSAETAKSLADAQNLVQNYGYSQPNPEQLQGMFMTGKYGTPGQQVITGLEHAGSSATFGLSTGLERALGVPGQDILNRSRINPGSAAIGDVAGLVGSSLLGYGEGTIMAKAGGLASRAVGEAMGQGILAKIGSSAANMAVQTAMMQGGSDVSKMIAGDPNTTAESTIGDMGMAALLGGGIGGAFGTVPALWQASRGPQVVRSFLDGLKDKVNVTPSGDVISDLEKASEAPIPDQLKPAMSNFQPARDLHASLVSQGESASGAAKSQIEAVNIMRGNVSDQIGKEIGIPAEELPAFGAASKAEAGEAARAAIKQQVLTNAGPVGDLFDQVKKEMAGATIPPEGQATLANQLTALRQPFESLGEESNEYNVLSKMLNLLPQQKTWENWQAYQNNFLDKVWGENPSQTMWKIARPLTSTMRSWENDFIDKTLAFKVANGEVFPTLQDFLNRTTPVADNSVGSLALRNATGGTSPGTTLSIPAETLNPGTPVDAIGQKLRAAGKVEMPGPGNAAQVMAQIKQARAQYSAAMGDVDDLANILHPGAYQGPKTFLSKLDAMPAERIIDRLTPDNNSAALNMLSQKFPEAAKSAQRYFQQDMVSRSISPINDQFAPEKYLRQYAKLTPELKNFLYSPEQQVKMDALRAQLGALPTRFSPSGPLLKRYMSRMVGGLAPTIGYLMGGVSGGAMGAVLGHVAKYLADAGPDAVSLAGLKYLGSHGAVDAGAFYTMAHYMQSALASSKVIQAGVSAAINSKDKPVVGTETNPKDDKKLEAMVEQYTKYPEQFLNVGGNLGYYLPDHQGHVANIVARAVSYLNSIKPSSDPLGALDSKRVPSPTDQANYSRSLSLVNHPLSILDTLRKGNLNSQDLAVMEGVYPGLYNKLKGEITTQLIAAHAKGQVIPYQRRLVFSQFLGQNLDSTIGPGPLLTSPPPRPRGQPPQPGRGQTTKMKELKKAPGMEQTMTQRAEQDRSQPSESA